MATDQGWDAQVWQVMAAQLGLQGLALPEEFGGSGYGFVDQQIVLEEMGRALLCAPYLSCVVLAANTLLTSGDRAACAELVPRIATGELLVTVASVDAAPATTAAPLPGGDGWLLSGEKTFVLDGLAADVLLVSAATELGTSLFLVDAAARGMTRGLITTLDETRKQATVGLAETPARLVGELGAADAVMAAALERTLVGLVAEEVGVARQMLDVTVHYVKIREQFGRPVGSFQAVKHRCTEMLMEVETATSAAYAAGWALDEASPEAAMLAHLAQATCAESLTWVATEMIEMHGGIGFTWEHPAHLYYKRALSSANLFGTARSHRLELAGALGIGSPGSPAHG